MSARRLLITLAVFTLASRLLAGPSFVDLTAVVNTPREDDGIANNGLGGWSDEGINDMGVYPPIPVGEVERNAHHFTLVDPAKNDGRAVLMLKGTRAGKDKPERAEIPVSGLKGAYLYAVQNFVGSVGGQPPAYVVATWTVQYADGSSVEIPMHAEVEIRDWWCAQWWDNSGAKSWPVFMGRNFYSQKYNKMIGVWAMQWANPSPEKAITNLVIQSAGIAAPVLWAITLDDANYHASEFIKKDFERPPGVPDDFFNARLDKERKAIIEAAVAEGRLKGLRSVEVIRPDLLRVVVDSALGGIGPGSGSGIIEKFQTPETFAVGNLKVASVGRQSYEAWRGDIGVFPANTLFHHAFYVKLATPMQAGKTYSVKVLSGLAAPMVTEMPFAFDPAKSETPVIKVNQVAYSGKSGARYAYLGWWAGDLGAVDYSDFANYEVVEEKTGKVIAQGELKLRAENDEKSGEKVYEINLSNVPAGSSYVVRVPGLGRSSSFAVGGPAVRDLFYHTSRAFFHQRCGQELKAPYSDFPREACHLKVYESGYLVGNPDYLPKPGEAVREFRGGYHDAADNDCFTYHLRATAQLLAVYEQYPSAFKDKDLNIPESGNGIPDVLDEAWWALEFYFKNQQEDGGILKGRGNDQDAIRDWERQHKGRPPFGNFPPTEMSCTEYAAVAAQLARLIRPFDAARSAALVKSADRAVAWARTHADNPPDKSAPGFQVWAVAELFKTTGQKAYSDEVVSMVNSGAFKQLHWGLAQYAPIFKWAYATCEQPGTDAKVRDELRASIISSADWQVKNTESNVYRMGHAKGALGWGNGNGGGHYADSCLRAYWMTGKDIYLTTASLNADFQLGANPLSKTFISGMGSRPSVQPQINYALYTEPKKTGKTVKGITAYGLGGSKPPGYPVEVPAYRCWRDIGESAEMNSEFTITETVGASAMLYAALYAEEMTKPGASQAGK